MRNYCTSLYICFLVLVFPLYYQNNYINMLEAKTTIYTIGTLIFAAAILIGLWYDSVKKYEAEQKLKKKQKTTSVHYEKSWITILFWIFIVVIFVSAIISGDFWNAWHGMETKRFGVKTILLCCAAYLLTCNGFSMNKVVKYSLCIGLTAVCVLAVFNRFDIDILHMYDNLLPKQKPYYVSTIGNVNILSNFLCVFAPVAMGLFLYAKEKPDKFMYGWLVVLCVMDGLASNSDSFFLGFGGALAVYLWFAMASKPSASEYLQMLGLCGLGMWLLKIMNKISSKAVPWESLQLLLIEEVPWLLIVLVLTAGWFGLKKTGYEVQWHRLRLGTFCALGVCFAGFIIYVISGNLNGGENLPQMLVFSDSWGTNRGYAWTNTVALFGELPFHQKLIGIGPGAFYDFFEVPNQIRKVPFVDPHSDYLYYLVTTGLIGFIAWFGMIAAGIVSCWKKQTPETITIAAVLIAWMMQAAVNCSIVFTAPYLFAALGIARWQTREISKEKKVMFKSAFRVNMST